MFGNTFDKQLEKTLKASEKYSNERDKLKKLFCDEYDNMAIVTLLNSLLDKGHPSEKMFASAFRNHYESDNYNEVEIKEFDRLYKKYKEEIINTLEENGEQ